MTRFDPHPGAIITLSQKQYKVLPHPRLKDLPFAQEGRKAIVYQLENNGRLYALKIFKSTFRDPSLVIVCKKLNLLNLPGFDVFHRECFTNEAQVSKYPDMQYAILMPWIKGPTWFDIMASNLSIAKGVSKILAKNTAEVLASLEKLGYAHCDVAAGNVVVNTSNGKVNFIDIEDMFGPDLPKPNSFPRGTDGYQHVEGRVSSTGQWRKTGDRFAAAILLAEMLAWHNVEIRKAADKEHYFSVDELQKNDSANYRLMRATLEEISSAVAQTFERAWNSTTLDGCPSLAEWVGLLQIPFMEEGVTIQSPPSLPPYKPQFEMVPVTQWTRPNK